ncbi:cytochrome P450 20A1-like isoform X2 [Glandiceps talaboti]
MRQPILAGCDVLIHGSTRSTTIPGRDPSDLKEGNLPDISAAGSFHEFLVDLHAEFGNIASFYYGSQLCVSLASVDLWKQHQNVFDKPGDLFLLYRPLIGENSILYANKGSGRSRRKLHDQNFSELAVKKHYEVFHEVCEELVDKLKSVPNEEHIPLCQYMVALALKALLRSLFGKYFYDDRAVLELKKNFDVSWHEIEQRLHVSEVPSEDSPRQKRFQKAIEGLQRLFRNQLKRRKENASSDEGNQLFIDVLAKSSNSEEEAVNDAITYLMVGFHSTAYLLAWALYFIASDDDVQDKVYKELKDVLPDEKKVNPENLKKLRYLHQVVKESMRCSTVLPWTARYQEIDVEIGGHVIPKNTPVIHALGVVLQDELLWPLPNRFDPDRFTDENSATRADIAFSPFGFAGQRSCPAAQYINTETALFLAELCKHFKWNMVEGQVVEPKYGLFTQPREEIWVTVHKR